MNVRWPPTEGCVRGLFQANIPTDIGETEENLGAPDKDGLHRPTRLQ